jgi:DNA-binding MarR family transcriptional regulator/GNAT superfamily N-acetyltransferase
MSISAAQIARVRAFNRDYTRRIGVLADGLLDSPYSLTEVRVMYEIAHRDGITAGELAEELDLDRGYLSRLLKGFETKRLLARQASQEDGRRQHLRLTPAGRRVFEPLERRSQEQVKAMLAGLDEDRRGAVLKAMEVIQSALGGKPEPSGAACLREGAGRPSTASARAAAPARVIASGQATSAQREADAHGDRGALGGAREQGPAFTLRTHQPGDMGWVVQRHGEVYFREYGWTEEFEALVAEITVEFVRKLDPARERCWIAEHNGQRVGCIFLVAKDATTAKLRLLLVEPEARGLGVGRTLVNECVKFAREAGYRQIVLWTQENLSAARHLYAQAGFQVTAREPHHSFGHDLVAETWELELRAKANAEGGAGF